jgi:septal ring factor EnvC (AmiA/AmiB activator)
MAGEIEVGDVSPYTVGALVVALIGPILTWLVARRKVAVDESAEVFARWKLLTDQMNDMADQHRTDMAALREELRLERVENAALRQRVRVLEAEIEDIRRESREERAGFVSQIRHLQKTLQDHGIAMLLQTRDGERERGKDE